MREFTRLAVRKNVAAGVIGSGNFIQLALAG
jgi:hypothetical protein